MIICKRRGNYFSGTMNHVDFITVKSKFNVMQLQIT